MIYIEKDSNGKIYKWVVDGIKDKDPIQNDLTIGIYYDNVLVAGIIFTFFSKFNAYISAYSEDKKWCSRRVINFLYDYLFDELNFKKLTCIAAKNNKKAKKFLTKLGFRLEGVIKYGRLNGTSAFIFGLCSKDKNRNKFKRMENKNE